MSHLSRRSLVTSAAALSALAVPAVAVASVAQADPVFAVIAAHRAAFLERMRVARFNMELGDESAGKNEADAAEDAAREIEHGLMGELLEAVPTTTAGIIALLRYIEEFHEQAIELSEEPNEWHSGPEEIMPTAVYLHPTLLDKFSGEPLELPFAYWVMRNVRLALQSLTVQS